MANILLNSKNSTAKKVTKTPNKAARVGGSGHGDTKRYIQPIGEMDPIMTKRKRGEKSGIIKKYIPKQKITIL